jgi:hypothetical protein
MLATDRRVKVTVGDLVAVLVAIAAIAVMVAVPAKSAVARSAWYSLAVSLIAAALVIGFLNLPALTNSEDREAAPGPTTSSNSAPAPQGPPGADTGGGVPPEPFVRTTIDIDTPLKATLYFGRLDSVVKALDGKVTFQLREGFAKEKPDVCVSTIVVEGAPNANGSVSYGGLGETWGLAGAGVESQGSGTSPGPNPDAVLHQPLVVPPTTLWDNEEWTGFAIVNAGGIASRSRDYTLSYLGSNGTGQIWSVDSRGTAACRINL